MLLTKTDKDYLETFMITDHVLFRVFSQSRTPVWQDNSLCWGKKVGRCLRVFGHILSVQLLRGKTSDGFGSFGIFKDRRQVWASYF